MREANTFITPAVTIVSGSQYINISYLVDQCIRSSRNRSRQTLEKMS